jgi:hypothetical protein
MNLLQAMNDERLFKSWFKNPTTWGPWRAFISALFGYGLEGDALTLYRSCTGRKSIPSAPFRACYVASGRRSGKSFILALIAVYLATFRDYRAYLQPGERATILLIAADRKQARVILRYIHGLLTGVPMLAALIERETAESFD